MSKNGTKVVVKFNDVADMGEVTSNFDMSIDMIETTVKASAARSKTYEAGENGATFTVESQLASTDGAILAAYINEAKSGDIFPFVQTSGDLGDLQISGNCLISGISISQPKNDVRTVSYSAQVTGAYTATVIAE